MPASAQLIRFYIDTIVDEVVGGGTMTTMPVTVGTAAAGTQYVTAIESHARSYGTVQSTHVTAGSRTLDRSQLFVGKLIQEAGGCWARALHRCTL